jgi:uncharacterized membrane protein YjgN (DUF898 family)
MTASYAPEAAAAAPVAGAALGQSQSSVRFLGREQEFRRLLTRGAVLLLLTLGIYRFWLATDVRRFLWCNTEVAGHPLEYNGTALELLIGFLIAIAILIPINVAFFIAALQWGVFGEWVSALAFLFLVVLAQFAVYRARRYRLSRTIYRGVRFHQTGSALGYAVRATGWWIAFALTFGLSYPWAQADLERVKLKNTYYGTLPGRFEASAWPLFLRGLALWLIVMGPLVACVIAAVAAVDWPGVVAIPPSHFTDADATRTGLAHAAVLVFSGVGWAITAAILLYPAFLAMTLRWWLSGLRLGPIAATSQLRVGELYHAYGRFVKYAAMFAIVAITLLVGSFATLGLILSTIFPDLWTRTETGYPQLAETLAVIAAIGTYVVTVLGLSAIYHVVVKLAVWRLSVDSLALSNVAAFDGVKAAGLPASPIGEGLADALNVGGL